MMNLNFVVIGIISGLILTFFVGVGCYKAYYNDVLEHWVPPMLIVGALIMMLFGSVGYGADKSEKLYREIKNTITSNYNDVTNYHDDDQQSFVSDGIKYTFDYNKNQKTLTVFNNISVVDATFIDGVKQKNSK